MPRRTPMAAAGVDRFALVAALRLLAGAILADPSREGSAPRWPRSPGDGVVVIG